MTHEPMSPVTAARPCPACGKPDWCLIREDGKKGICSRVQSSHKAGEAGWFHVYEDEPLRERAPSRNGKGSAAGKKKPTAEKPREYWQAEVERFASRVMPEHLAALASSLGVPGDALAQFPLVGYCNVVNMLPTFSCPETDAGGKVVGYVERFPKGNGREVEGKYLEKITPPGSKRGLTIPADLADRGGPLFCVEAFSDTVAMTAAGTACVGRPFNRGGAEFLTELFRDVPADRAIVIVGEHDRKPPCARFPDGEWPGLDGMNVVAAHLARELNRPILTALPPDGAKDVRVWLTHHDRGETPWADRGRELVEKLLAAAVAVEPGMSSTADAEDPSKWADDPADPYRLARLFLASLSPPGEPIRLRYWRDEFHEWQDGRYVAVSDGDLKARLGLWVRRELERVYALDLKVWTAREAGERGRRPKVAKVSKAVVSDTIAALGGLCVVPRAVDIPAWLDGFNGPDPKHTVHLRNGVYDLHTRRLIPPTASFFSFAASDFDYTPNAPEPAGWLSFLQSVWGDDRESVECLQEWFGYCLTPDTSQQKFLFVLGPPRAGKGTMAKVLENLVGKSNLAGLSLSDFAAGFLDGLTTKSVLMVGDGRLSGRDDQVKVTEKLLTVVGQDKVRVNRKYLPAIDAVLPGRLVILSNELPSLFDSSGALNARMLLLKLHRSFVGSEDVTMSDRLRAEMPGVFLWALEGYYRLRRRGHFLQPASGRDDLAEMKDLSSPVSVFVRERCVVGANEQSDADELFAAWVDWCSKTGRKDAGNTQTFGKFLTSAYPAVSKAKNRRDATSRTGFRRFRYGIRLMEEHEHEPGSDAEAESVTRCDASQSKSLSANTRDIGDLTGQPANPVARCDATLSFCSHSENKEEQEGEGEGKRRESNIRKMPVTPSHGVTPNALPDAPSGLWLYVSRKLELDYLPTSKVVEVFLSGAEAFYRLTPAVFVWFEHEIAGLTASPPSAEQLAVVVDAQTKINAFARRQFTERELADARRAGPQPLPTPEPVPTF